MRPDLPVGLNAYATQGADVFREWMAKRYVRLWRLRGRVLGERLAEFGK